MLAAGVIPRNSINDYLDSQNSYLKIQNDHLYKVDKKEIALSDEVKMNKSESTLLGKLNCGNLILRDCLDLLVKHQDLISSKGSEAGAIDVASFQ
jgi:hypothetical protein